MSNRRITNEVFINLFIGKDWADVTGLNGGKLRIRVPREFDDDIDAIRRECNTIVIEYKKEEFSITRTTQNNERIIFRVTAFENTDGHMVFMIRRPLSRVMELVDLGFGSDLISLLTRPNLKGVVGFVGEMGSGKTTAAASSVRGWLMANGGVALAVEDPPETNLEGEHGDGRCISVEVRSASGGYKGALKKGMRSGADLIYVGEVRDEGPADMIALHGMNGHLLYTTWHGLNIPEAVKRLRTMCTVKDPDGLIATGLAAIVHLSLVDRPVSTLHGKKMVKKVEYDFLEVAGHMDVQNVIRSGEFHKLEDVVESQRATRAASI